MGRDEPSSRGSSSPEFGPARMSRAGVLTVAIMQPYFLPYAGYFRLFVASDVFVIYDCVQFPRHGWVHRNRLVDARGVDRWLTLPLEKAPRSTLIRELRFLPNATEILAHRLRPFDLMAENDDVQQTLSAVRDVRGSPLDYIERLLRHVVAYLGFRPTLIRSSTLAVPAAIRGQQRILEIARRLGAGRYLNAPGGRHLYDGAAFADAGIDLRFLDPYPGPSSSILTRMTRESRDDLARDVRETTRHDGAEMTGIPFRPGGI